jgi:hypothetical protein
MADDGSGVRGETVDEVLWLDQTADPSELGMTRMVNGVFRFVDKDGVFNLRTGGSGITEAQHEALDTLVHWIDETNWQEIVRSGGKVTNVINWETDAKLKKVRECIITRSGGKVSQLDAIQYDGAGVEKMRLTGVITRAGGKVASIAWTKTVA